MPWVDCCPQDNYGGEDWALLEIWTLARRPHGPVSGLGAFGGLLEPSAESETTRVAREYYDSADADNFYYEVWGGEDLHLGWYESPNESIKQASIRAVEKLAARVELTADWALGAILYEINSLPWTLALGTSKPTLEAERGAGTLGASCLGLAVGFAAGIVAAVAGPAMRRTRRCRAPTETRPLLSVKYTTIASVA